MVNKIKYISPYEKLKAPRQQGLWYASHGQPTLAQIKTQKSVPKKLLQLSSTVVSE